MQSVFWRKQCRMKNPVVRLLFVGTAFVLTDIWVYLILMLTFLCQAVDQRHRMINAVYL